MDQDEELAYDMDEQQKHSTWTRRVPEDRRTPFQIWLVSYSDFMTILTIFFLAMYGYAYLDAAALVSSTKSDMTYSAFSDLVRKLQDESKGQIKVEDQVDKVVIALGEGILFPSGSSQLSLSADRTLKDLAGSLNRIKGDIMVQGHTDNVPMTGGRFRSNWELSVARAFSVIEKLTEKGIPAKRLAAWGFGENRPLVENDTTEHRAQNRRIEIVVLKTGSEK